MTAQYDAAPYEADETRHRRRLADAVARHNQGKINVTLDVTLRASQVTTVVTDSRFSAVSFIAWLPMTASASTAEKAGIWASPTLAGTVTLNHASSVATDQALRLLIIG